MSRTVTVLAVGAALALGLAAGAEAHAKLIKSSPAPNGLAKDVKTLELSFNEALSGKLSGADLTDAAGKKIPSTATAGRGAKALLMTLKAPLKRAFTRSLGMRWLPTTAIGRQASSVSPPSKSVFLARRLIVNLDDQLQQKVRALFPGGPRCWAGRWPYPRPQPNKRTYCEPEQTVYIRLVAGAGLANGGRGLRQNRV